MKSPTKIRSVPTAGVEYPRELTLSVQMTCPSEASSVTIFPEREMV